MSGAEADLNNINELNEFKLARLIDIFGSYLRGDN